MSTRNEDIELLRFCNLDKSRQAIKMEALRTNILDDEDFRFPRVKIDGKKPRYELPMPVKGDPDNCETVYKFQAVVLLAKKNYYLSEEDKEAGKDAKEKRALYLLRLGRFVPDLFYLSPTAVRNWKYFVRDIVKGNHDYFAVLVEFSAELIKGEKYSWCKPKFAVVRALDKDECAHIVELRTIIEERVSQWEADADLDKYENEALSVDRRGDQVEEVDDTRQQRKRQAEIEDEDETPAAPVKARTRKAKPVEEDEDETPAPKTSKKSVVEEDEDETPAPKTSKKSVVDEDEDETPAPKKAAYPSLDDDDDDLAPAPKTKKKPVVDEDDD